MKLKEELSNLKGDVPLVIHYMSDETEKICLADSNYFVNSETDIKEKINQFRGVECWIEQEGWSNNIINIVLDFVKAV